VILAVPVLVKGGHLRGIGKKAVDIFNDGRVDCCCKLPFIKGPHCPRDRLRVFGSRLGHHALSGPSV